MCGKGVQSRRVVCGTFDGDSIKTAEDETKCTDKKPDDTKECEVETECPGEWFTGPWTVCDKDCGGGQRTRKVLCLSNGTAVPATKCDQETIEFTKEDCNKEPCIEDETIPVDLTSTTVTDDDQSEEWCDDEDDDEEESELAPRGLEVVMVDDETSVTPDLTSVSSDDSSDSTLTDDELMMSDSTETSSSDILRKLFRGMIR